MDSSQTRMFSLTRTQQYGIAILSVFFVAAVRWMAEPLLLGQLPFFFFVFPLVLSCWLGGLWPGLLATGLSLALGTFFLAPGESVAVRGGSFGLLGIAFSLVFDWSQKAAKAEWLERKNAQENVQFLSELNEALLPLVEVGQIMTVSVHMLAEHLGVDRCTYAEAETGNEQFVVLADYTRDPASGIGGEDNMCELEDEGRRMLSENRPHIVNDVETQFPTGKDLSVYRRAGIRSLVCVPLKKEGSFVARIAVHQETPRRWSNEEIKLISIVVNRCWEAAVRARAVRRLKDSDERYRAFISNSSEAVWRYELDKPIPVTLPEDEQVELFYQHGYLAECNEAFARIHGRSSVDEIVGERVTVLLVRIDAKEIIEHSRAFVRGGYRLMGLETREVDIHGNAKYFLSNLIGIEENGAIVRVWGTQRDITQYKETENALRASEERLRRITEATQDALWEIDLKTNQLWWSEGARPLFGHSPAELRIGLEDWYKGIHPEDVARVHDGFEEFMKTDVDEWADEYRFRRADGSYVYIQDGGCKFRGENGIPLHIDGAMVDITERRTAEAAIRESEERFSKAFLASPDCLVISRVADGLIIEANDSFASLAGYRREELLGKSTLALGLYADPKDRERMATMLIQQNYVRDFEFAMKRKSGEIRLMRFSAEPLELRGEHCWLTIGHDVTERKRADEALERLLRQEKASREEAEAANRMKDEFLATVSHELRTPLTAIMGWTSMLLNRALPEPQVQHALEVIARSAKSQSELIADILDMSRIITGRLKLDVRPFEIETAFQAAIDVVRPSAQAKHVALQVVMDGNHTMIFGDATRLQQAIWNLLSNAVKFTDAGGHIEAKLTHTLDEAEISVTDSGIGIDPQFLPYLFERFRQADSSSTRRYGGLGLGLAIVRHVVEMHGGRVSAVSSGEGRGATFKITLPLMANLQAPHAEVRPLESTPAAPAAGTPEETIQTLDHVRVLVVEDDADTLDVLKAVLNNYGADVVTATSAREAIDTFEHWQPDVLVSDLAMPDQDGYQLIRQLRSRDPDHGGNTPAVALTAYARNEDRTRALAAGFQMHLAKPIAPRELIAALASLSGHTTKG
jgi:PAS domain S-box-containing protein